MDKIDSIIFDLGGVLVDFHPLKGIQELGFSEKAQKAFEEQIFSGLWEECDRIPYEEEEIRNLFKQRVPGYEAEVDLLWDNLPVITGVKDDTMNWLENLKERGYHLYVLSNFGKRAFEINSKTYDFLKLMDGKVVSYEIQKCKPEPEIYRELETRFGIEPARAVFIDDRENNVIGARQLGYHGIVFESYQQAKEELEKLL